MRTQCGVQVMQQADITDIIEAGILVKQARLKEQSLRILMTCFSQRYLSAFFIDAEIPRAFLFFIFYRCLAL